MGTVIPKIKLNFESDYLVDDLILLTDTEIIFIFPIY